MKLIHYLRVASHFSPAERAFWVAMLHDSIEDGWYPKRAVRWIAPAVAHDVAVLTRWPGSTYAQYIQAVSERGGDAIRVKRADLAENYARAPASLRRRYAKAMAVLAE